MGAIAWFYFLAGYFLGPLFEHFRKVARDEHPFTDKIERFMTTRWPFYISILVMAYAAWATIADHMGMFSTLVVVFTALFVMFEIAAYINIHEKHDGLHIRYIIEGLMSLGWLMAILGWFYASYFAGTTCNIVLKDGRFERAEYIRFIGEGHLIRMGGRIYFEAKDQVKEIICGNFKPSKA